MALAPPFLLRRQIPFRSGSGLFTAGTPASVTDDTKYNAWPVACRMANGSLLLGYTKGDTHHEDNTGRVVVRVSSNEGSSWAAEVTAYDHASLWSSLMGLASISTGRIFATLWRDDFATAGTGEAGIVYSDDNGATWSSWIALTNGFTQEAYGAGPVVELADGTGDLLVTIEGSNTGQAIANRSSHTLKSTDNGATWGSEVSVRAYATDSRPYYESKLIRVGAKLLCIHRCAAVAGLPHYISTSLDWGATWGAPVAAFAGYAAPSTIRTASGTLVAVTRRDSDAVAIAYSSVDGGVTWVSEIEIDDTMYEMEYGCPVQLLDGTVLVVYGYQPTSATTNSDIKQAVLTEIP